MRFLSLKRLLATGAAALMLLPGATPHVAADGCQYILGFKTLHDLDAADVADCTDNQVFAANGDAQQHSPKGLLAWRKADNWTAFTNGYQTWVNGPNGLQSRLNTQRFSFEANPEGLPVVDGGNVAAPAAPAAGGPTNSGLPPFDA